LHFESETRKESGFSERSSFGFRSSGRGGIALLLLTFLCCAAAPRCAGQANTAPTGSALPEAPQSQLPASAAAPVSQPKAVNTPGPCAAQNNPSAAVGPTAPCLPPPPKNWFERFLTGPEVKPLTPAEKARLAARNVLDPFNGLTILGDSAIATGLNAHSAYGPGMRGFARNVGVSTTQDLSGEFLCTFLIPSIMGQDPHYHRMPDATIPRRIRHAIVQIAWTQGDNGKGMVNYGDLVGGAAVLELSNLYVPGQQTNLPASAQRYGIGLATAPIDNFVSEFLPDVARHIHVQIVVIQRIINKVAQTGGSATQ
jgi:hypothetical protein